LHDAEITHVEVLIGTEKTDVEMGEQSGCVVGEDGEIWIDMEFGEGEG
jgi:hypothetical protein